MRAIIIIALLASVKIQAQIYFENPSLTGQPCWSGCLPDNWSSCNFTSILFNVDSQYWKANCDCQYYPTTAAHGKTFFMFEKDSNASRIELGDLSQKLDCPLQMNSLYFFDFHSTSLFLYDSVTMSFSFGSKGYVEVYLGHDSCDKAQLIYKTRALDTIWEKQEVYFKPNAPYQWISFWPEKDYADYIVDMAVDAFSPIYLLNAHAVDIVQADTVLEQSGQVYIEATPSIGSINSVFWIRVHNGGIDTVARQTYRYTATQSGTYIVAARDSIVGCAGVEWSFDTVRVSMPTGLDEIKDNEFYFYLYPNPKDANQDIVYIQNSEKGTLRLYNNIGQLVHSATLIPLFNEIQLSHLSAGVYTYKVVFDTGKVETAKLIIR